MSNEGESSTLFRASPDRFEEWLRAPVPFTCTDPRFEIRRAQPSEFEQIYDLVDETFGFKRPRPVCDWLYRRNPRGKARCWVVIEKGTGRMLGNGSSWPWPAARGAEALDACQSGDWAIAPGWQRQGVNEIRIEASRAHPWRDKTAAISWPNEKTRAASRKRGRGWRTMGPVPRRVAPLRTSEYLAARGWPRALAITGGGVADVVIESWRTMRLGRGEGIVEEVRRFDSGFDAVTEHCMSWPKFWCPHDAVFLNWRYLEHPTRTNHAFAVVRSAAPVGYAVLQIEGERAWLMEFVASQEAPDVARTLLRHAVDIARDAGCWRLDFFAPLGWRHWRVFQSAGFLYCPSRTFFYSRGRYEPEINQLTNWQFVPGDADFV